MDQDTWDMPSWLAYRDGKMQMASLSFLTKPMFVKSPAPSSTHPILGSSEELIRGQESWNIREGDLLCRLGNVVLKGQCIMEVNGYKNYRSQNP